MVSDGKYLIASTHCCTWGASITCNTLIIASVDQIFSTQPFWEERLPLWITFEKASMNSRGICQEGVHVLRSWEDEGIIRMPHGHPWCADRMWLFEGAIHRFYTWRSVRLSAEAHSACENGIMCSYVIINHIIQWLWLQLWEVWENNPDEVLVMSSGLSQFGLTFCFFT